MDVLKRQIIGTSKISKNKNKKQIDTILQILYNKNRGDKNERERKQRCICSHISVKK